MSFDSANFLWENTLKWTKAILKLISINYIFSFYFIGFGHEMISTAILSLPLIKVGLLSVTGEIECALSTG